MNSIDLCPKCLHQMKSNTTICQNCCYDWISRYDYQKELPETSIEKQTFWKKLPRISLFIGGFCFFSWFIFEILGFFIPYIFTEIFLYIGVIFICVSLFSYIIGTLPLKSKNELEGSSHNT
jgi:hypothetical protein